MLVHAYKSKNQEEHFKRVVVLFNYYMVMCNLLMTIMFNLAHFNSGPVCSKFIQFEIEFVTDISVLNKKENCKLNF